MKRNKMTRKFSLSVSCFATAAVSVTVAGAIVLSPAGAAAGNGGSGGESTYYTGGAEVGTEVTPTPCDLAKIKAQVAFVACITKAQAKGIAVSGALVMEEREINGPDQTRSLYLPLARRDEAACEKTLAKAFDSAEKRLAGCTTTRNARQAVSSAIDRHGLIHQILGAGVACTGSGCSCNAGTYQPCSTGYICCSTADLPGGSGMCATSCNSATEGSTCNSGTLDACDHGLTCCTQLMSAPGATGNCESSCISLP
jgi:hypothetical protein